MIKACRTSDSNKERGPVRITSLPCLKFVALMKIFEIGMARYFGAYFVRRSPDLFVVDPLPCANRYSL